MKIMRTLVLVPLVAFFLFYIAGAIYLYQRGVPELDSVEQQTGPFNIAIFGASGTAGDGVLKAALKSKDIESIVVVTRRSTARIEDGIALGKVTVIKHQDYLNYTPIIGALSEVDAVFWALGTSSIGVDEKTYGMIHVDFPVAFVRTWNNNSKIRNRSFHYISSSDISPDSTAMWAREKVRAENELFKLSSDNKLSVIAYRPDYIGPTLEEAHLGQKLLYWFFRPVGAAVKAIEIGNAMIESTKRGLSNKTKLSTMKIIQLNKANQSDNLDED